MTGGAILPLMLVFTFDNMGKYLYYRRDNMSDVLRFRNALAENGIEYTPKEAEDVKKKCEKFIERIEDVLANYPNYAEELKSLNDEDKKLLRESIFEYDGVGIGENELNELIGLILDICDKK
jgi:hypothetical protein